jgi:glycosyltransferase involved in cell wall biosynthesis
VNEEIKVLVLTKYDAKGASSRLRSIQYFPGLEANGISIEHSPLFDDFYLENLYSDKKISKAYVFKRYFQRVMKLFSSKSYDLLWIEKELFPWIPFNVEGLLKALGIKYIVDYDDAIFHNYDQHRLGVVRFLLSCKIPNVMKNAALVTVCNSYLKQKAIDSGAKRVELMPTVVDLDRYQAVYEADNDILTIGWIGTPKTEMYIMELCDVFEKVSQTIDIKVVVIGGRNFHSDKFDYEILPWCEEREIEYLQQIDVGIMPLSDTNWEKGKCGYKLIQYMACGKPVVASAIGMNCEIVEENKNGYLASTSQEWIDSFIKLSDSKLRVELGKKARKDVEEKYSLQNTLAKGVKFIKDSFER